MKPIKILTLSLVSKYTQIIKSKSMLQDVTARDAGGNEVSLASEERILKLIPIICTNKIKL